MNFRQRALCGIIGLGILFPHLCVHAVEVNSYPKLILMIDELVSEEGLNQEQLELWLADARIDQDVVKAIQRPAERLPWYQYKKRFVTRASIRNGERFFSQHSNILRRAEDRFGVPAEIIVAIIGVETRYGKVTGRRRVLDSLTTLALEYPRRSAFFAAELKEFLRLSSAGILNALETKGSYAGAVGIPQFMPSSYRHYAIDFDGDGKRDLIESEADAIGSVAHYLNTHGWKTSEPVVEHLGKDDSERIETYVTRGLKANISLEELKKAGVHLNKQMPILGKVGVIRLEMESDNEYRVAHPNFFVITRYNRSQNYAMVVFELAEKIAKRIDGD